jgi:hypothetical protein
VLATSCSATDAELRADEVQRNAADLRSKSPTNALKVLTRPIAVQAGYYMTPAPGQDGALVGTDLGSSFVHRDKLWVMFGDSWHDEEDMLNLANEPDDAMGQVSLADFPDGESVDAFVEAHPAAPGTPAWRAAAPTLSLAVEPTSGYAPVLFTRGEKLLPGGIGRVPITSFSNGRDDAGEAVFAIFSSNEFVPCHAGACDAGYECDGDLGSSIFEIGSPPCVFEASPGCVAGPGYCQDRGISMYDPRSIAGRTESTVVQLDVGFTTPDKPTHFETQPWTTKRFLN